MSAFLAALSVITLLPGAATAVHLGVLGVASVFYRNPRRAPDIPPVRFLVLVPAYNEERVIGATLAAVTADMRPSDQLVVIADRCTDATATLARAAGAQVLERQPDEEPGRAAARQAGIEFATDLTWDALVMIDADSIIEPGFFSACEAALASGAEALQARSEAALGTRILDHASLAAFAMQGVLMPRGRDRLGLLVRLRGTGMVLSRRVVSTFTFRAPASEDLWYSLDLCLAGVHPRHVERARLRSVTAGNWQDAGAQRVRYEAGRMSAAHEFAGPLLRRHDAASIEAAWFLLTPPFAVAVFLLGVSALLAFLAGATVLGGVAIALIGVLAAVLALALVEARVGLRTWVGLALAPWYVPWKAIVQIRALFRLRRHDQAYEATPRA